MNEHFQRFKRRAMLLRILKALFGGGAIGALTGGVLLALSRLAIIAPEPILVLPVGVGAGLVTFALLFFLLHCSDRRLARTLDERLSLRERVQTAVAFREQSGGMIELQREDAERALADAPARALGMRRLWIYLLAFLLGAGVLTASFFAPYRRDLETPVPVVPFEVSEVQIAGIGELIRYVDASQMEEPYRSELSATLSTLLADLRAATTEPQMETALATALTEITEITYDASSMTEILNVLWESADGDVRLLAQALYTGDWTEPSWGDFAEAYTDFRASLTGESAVTAAGEEAQTTLRWRLEGFTLKVSSALGTSGIVENDPLRAILTRLLEENGASEDGTYLRGTGVIAAALEEISHEEGRTELEKLLSALSGEIFGVISAQKQNTNVGEYVLKKLSSLFGVPIPEFERPVLKDGGDAGGDSDREEDAPGGGGVGEGAVFGSDDLVLDPRTGEYVTYGTLYATYNARMLERLENDGYGYTDEQKTAIEKYFALLYGGFKKEEGN